MFRGRSFPGIVAVVILLGAFALVPSWGSTTSQDNYEGRIAELEVRVTLLEATVEALAAEPTSIEATAPPAETFTLTGVFRIIGDDSKDFVIEDDGCRGLGDFNDVSVGGQMKVTDPDGKILAEGTLEDAPGRGENECQFSFTVEVPRAEGYVLNPGTWMRNKSVITFDQMVSSGWSVDLWIAATASR